MASYLEIKNANGRIVIDDMYASPKFCYRSIVNIPLSPKKPSGYLGPMHKYFGRFEIFSFSKPSDLGFDMPPGLDNDSDDAVIYIRKNLLLFVRSDSNTAVRVSIYIENSPDGGLVLYGYINAGIQYPVVEYCIYTRSKMLPCKYGAQSFNEKGELIYDAMRGYLSHIGTMNGGVNISKNPAATYIFELQGDLDSRNLFVSQNSTLPYYAAYNIHSGGVDYASTFFYPVMSLPDSKTLKVDLVKQFQVNGSNSASSFSEYFESVIYCPYPNGVWITGK